MLEVEIERDGSVEEIQQSSGIDEELLSKSVTTPTQCLFPLSTFISKLERKMKWIEKEINESNIGLEQLSFP